MSLSPKTKIETNARGKQTAGNKTFSIYPRVGTGDRCRLKRCSGRGWVKCCGVASCGLHTVRYVGQPAHVTRADKRKQMWEARIPCVLRGG